MKKLAAVLALVACASALGGTFVTGNTPLPSQKTDLFPPTGNSWELDATDINSLWSAAGDLRATASGSTNVWPIADGGDSSAVINAACDGGSLTLQPGTYNISGNVTCASDVTMPKGALLSVADTKTVAFGGFHAGVYPVFTIPGSGAVTFNRALVRVGHPEWWGCQPNTYANDCLAGLKAAELSLSTVQLQAADYYTSATWNILTPHVKITGVSKHWSGGTYPATRIVVKSATADVIQIGTTSQPAGGINNFLQEVELDYLQATRDRAVTPPTAGNETNGAAGIRLKYTLYTYLRHVSSNENTLGVVQTGTVQTHMEHVFGFRSTEGGTSTHTAVTGTSITLTSGSQAVTGVATSFTTQLHVGDVVRSVGRSTWYQITSIADNTHLTLDGKYGEATITAAGEAIISSTLNDIFWAFYQDNSQDIGGACGNASSYYTDTTASLGYTPATSPLTDSIGFALSSGYCDTFMIRPETASLNTGLQAVSVAGSSGNADLHIINPVFDSFGVRGIFISGGNLSSYNVVDIVDPYMAPANVSGALACIHLYQLTGAISVEGGQCIATSQTLGGGAVGLEIDSDSGVVSKNFKIIDSRRPEQLNGSANCKLEDVLQNPAATPTQAGVLVTGSSRSVVSPVVTGGSGLFPSGVDLHSSANTFNEINLSGVDPAAVASGSANKLLINTHQETATGCYKPDGTAAGTCGTTYTNLVSGVMQ